MIYLTLRQMLLLHQTVSGYSATETKRKLKEQWQSINWKRANCIVKSLQRRIVAAIKKNRWGKVKPLQWILTHSLSAKVLANRRVTENKGSQTSGIDQQIWNTSESKWTAVSTLNRKGYRAKAVKRVKIPKDNGKYRMLGIPTMRDRAMQALYLQALQPIAETLADHHSYGFRPYRSCHDAIEQCFIVLSRKDSAQYILEGDIKSCFDKISHQWLARHIPMDKRVLNQWLKSGVVDKKKWYPTDEGSPQGAIISPTLANMVLDGMADTIDKEMGIRYYNYRSGYRRRINNPYKIHFVRYADDWIVTAADKQVLEQRVKPAIEAFLQERGLELSTEKTTITSIQKGFDFLGQNVRKYNGKLIIKPSGKSVKKLLKKVRLTIKQMYTVPTYALIIHINRITKGWAMYHRHCCASKTFNWIDHHIWKAIWIWCLRRHNNKGRKWIFKRYFINYKGYRWTFFSKNDKANYHLHRMATVPIKRYVKIKATANPFVKEDEPIFELHLQRKMLNTWHKRLKLITIFRRQAGKCPICQQTITKQSEWNIHHKLERLKGGKDTLDNLVMLHPDCHRQVHFWNIQFDGDVPIRASEFA